VRWRLTGRFDRRAAALADRHYSRQTPGSPQFVPSGRALVLVTEGYGAVWATNWQVSHDGIAFQIHDWPLAWICSIFRNERPDLHRSSELVREAVAATVALWGLPPAQGFVTFVDADKVRPKRDPGRCFLRAGFRRVGATRSGKIALELAPADFPAPEVPLGAVGYLAGTEQRGFTLKGIQARRTRFGGPIVPA
jgi:hypothetical protein